MIRFRKAGGPAAAGSPQAAGGPATAASASPAKAAGAKAGNPWAPVTAANLEWWQTPEQYRKRDIDELECDIINVSATGNLKYNCTETELTFFREYNC